MKILSLALCATFFYSQTIHAAEHQISITSEIAQMVIQGDATPSYQTAGIMIAGKIHNNPTTRVLVKFPISDFIPKTARVKSASFAIHPIGGYPEVVELSMHRVLTPWENIELADQSGEYFVWKDFGRDLKTAPSSTQKLEVSLDWLVWEGISLQQDVIDWVKSPSSNHGWIIKGFEADGISSKHKGFASQTYPKSIQPELTITYETDE